MFICVLLYLNVLEILITTGDLSMIYWLISCRAIFTTRCDKILYK
jgi:hypothetical protein